MKATCYGCRALSGGPQSSLGYRCDLGFRLDQGIAGTTGPRPLVECPKPRTVRGVVYWLDMKAANGGRAPLYQKEDHKHAPR